MYDHYLSLKEFIEPLPICQPETDLGNILRIFQHSNCQMLAISQGKLGWGVINAEDLLSLVAEAWLGDRLSVTSHPRNFMYQPSISSRLIYEVNTLIEPAMVYQDDTKIDEFLSQIEYGSLTTKGVCLIVNQQGELQGRLNRDKIIEYLASKPALKEEAMSSKHNDLTDLLEAIALPSKIETARGEVAYTNQAWQQLTIENQEISTSSQVELDEMTKWLIDRQGGSLPPDSQDYRASDRQPDVIELEFSANPNIKVTQLSNWNYLKIPLISDGEAYTHSSAIQSDFWKTSSKDNRQQTAREPYYLVLATPQRQSPPTTDEPTSISTTPTSKVATNQLLATVSHELKSPLTGIVGLISLLQGQKIGSLNQRQAHYVKLIDHSSKKIRSVVDDLLQLTALTSDRPGESELIDLESLCRQLYQEVLNKIQSMTEKLNSSIHLTQLKLSIEQGSEIALADKLLLSSVLSHLISEAVVASETIEPLKIQIKTLSELMAIVITSETLETTKNPGLNLMIAKSLAEALEAEVTHACSTTSCQITLLLPKKNISSSDLTDIAAPKSIPSSTTASPTILCLYPELEIIDPQRSQNHSSNFDLRSWSDNYAEQTNYQHRIIEADSLEQAHNLARIWQLDAIILNGYQIAQPSLYLRSLQASKYLANLPLITLDTRITEAANQIKGLNVYPCLLRDRQCSIANLIQVIQIALEAGLNPTV